MFHHSSGTLTKINTDALGGGMFNEHRQSPVPSPLLSAAQSTAGPSFPWCFKNKKEQLWCLLPFRYFKFQKWRVVLLPFSFTYHCFSPVKLAFPGPQVEPKTDYWEGPFSVTFMFANILQLPNNMIFFLVFNFIVHLLGKILNQKFLSNINKIRTLFLSSNPLELEWRSKNNSKAKL